jgi:tetratricopeptide (TPR) repeat protein
VRRVKPPLTALALAAALLAGCGGTPPTPEPPLRAHAQDAENLGVRRHTQGDYAAAARQFATALRLHQSVDDLEATDRNRLQLAQTLLAQQQPQAALEQTQQVRTPGARVSALLLQAQALLDLKQASAAADVLAQAQNACTSPCAEQGRIALMQARTAWAQGLAAQTLALARAATTALKDRDEAHELANAHRLSAAAALALGDTTTALPSAQQALALDRQLAMPEKIARDWLLLGDIHTRAGNAASAREAYQRAFSVSQAAGLTALTTSARTALEEKTR